MESALSKIAKKAASRKPPSLCKPQHMVNIHVSEDSFNEGIHNSVFAVHKELICFYSKYFAKIFKGNRDEAKTKSTRVEYCELSEMGVIIQWMYTKELGEGPVMNFDELARLWLAANRFEISTLQNAIIDNIWRYKDTAASLQEALEVAYSGFDDSAAKLRSVLVACAVSRDESSLIPTHGISHEAWADMFRESKRQLKRNKSGEAVRELIASDFYVDEN